MPRNRWRSFHDEESRRRRATPVRTASAGDGAGDRLGDVLLKTLE